MAIFTGSGVALITPFDEKNEINFEKLRELLEYHIVNRTDAVIVTGTTMAIFTGSGVALITPFDEKNEINFEKLRELLEYHIVNRTDAVIVTGTTGESATMSDEEKLAVIKFSVDVVRGRIPVIAGTGSNNTKHAVWLSQEAEKLGADALLVVTPYYNKGNESGSMLSG